MAALMSQNALCCGQNGYRGPHTDRTQIFESQHVSPGRHQRKASGTFALRPSKKPDDDEVLSIFLAVTLVGMRLAST